MIAVRKRLSINSFRATGRGRRDSSARGQSLVEAALILPILLIILVGVLETGMALNAWLRVQTAARDATRFALDAGRASEIVSLVDAKLVWMDDNQINIYLIKGRTNEGGVIPNGGGNPPYWSESHLYGGSPHGARVTRQTIETRLGGAGNPHAYSVPFVIVEVDYVYVPVFLQVLVGDRRIHMTSYAIIHQY
jgi:hypothetical protein